MCRDGVIISTSRMILAARFCNFNSLESTCRINVKNLSAGQRTDIVYEESDAIRDQRLFGSVQKHYFYECRMRMRRRIDIIGALTFCKCVIDFCNIKLKLL